MKDATSQNSNVVLNLFFVNSPFAVAHAAKHGIVVILKAINDNKTLNYTKDKEYEARTSQQCNSILFITNDLGDKIMVNRSDFK